MGEGNRFQRAASQVHIGGEVAADIAPLLALMKPQGERTASPRIRLQRDGDVLAHAPPEQAESFAISSSNVTIDQTFSPQLICHPGAPQPLYRAATPLPVSEP